MPQDLLAFPPYYTAVGIYRLVTDVSLRSAVWAKVKHATVRGLIVGAVYTAVSYRAQRWFVGRGKVKPPPEVVSRSLGWLKEVDVVDCGSALGTPQLLSLIEPGPCARHHDPLPPPAALFPAQLLSQAQHPPGPLARLRPDHQVAQQARRVLVARLRRGARATAGRQRGSQQGARAAHGRRAGLGHVVAHPDVCAALWATVRGAVVQCPLSYDNADILIPISPILPIFNLAFNAATRGLYTARSLHEQYFALKRMTSAQIDLWMEERKWGYRGGCRLSRRDLSQAELHRLRQPSASPPRHSSKSPFSALHSPSRTASAPPCGPWTSRSGSIGSRVASCDDCGPTRSGSARASIRP